MEQDYAMTVCCLHDFCHYYLSVFIYAKCVNLYILYEAGEKAGSSPARAKCNLCALPYFAGLPFVLAKRWPYPMEKKH